MDPEDLQALGRGFWYRWAAAVTAGSVAVLGGAWALPSVENAWLAAVYGLMALLFAAFGAVSLALGDRVDAGGQALAAVGFAAVGVAAASDFPDVLFWGGWAVAVVGASVGLVTDLRDRRRAADG